jgi:hypothetical protein
MAIPSVRYRAASVRSGAAKKATLAVEFRAVNRGTTSAGSVNEAKLTVEYGAVNRCTSSVESRTINTTSTKSRATAVCRKGRKTFSVSYSESTESSVVFLIQVLVLPV